LKNLATETNYYIVIFEIIQFIDSKKRTQKIYKTTVYFINKVIARESTTSQYVFNNKISEIENIEKKKYKSEKKKKFKKQKKFSVKKIKKKNFKKRFKKKFKQIIKRKKEFDFDIKKEFKNESIKKKKKKKSDKYCVENKKIKIEFSIF